MSARNLVPAALGTFQTRASRIATITGTRMVPVARPGGGQGHQLAFSGTLFKMDGKTPDTTMLWNPDGSALNSRGVASDKDLCIVIKLAAPPPPDPEAQVQIEEEQPPTERQNPGELADDASDVELLKELNLELQKEVSAAHETIEHLTVKLGFAEQQVKTQELELVTLRSFKEGALMLASQSSPIDPSIVTGGPDTPMPGAPANPDQIGSTGGQ